MFARGAGWEVAKLEKRAQVPRACFSSCGAVEWMEGLQEWSEKLANTKNAPHHGACLLCLPERQCGKQPNSSAVGGVGWIAGKHENVPHGDVFAFASFPTK